MKLLVGLMVSVYLLPVEKKVFIICATKNKCLTTKKKQRKYMTIFLKEYVDIKGFDHGGHDVMYGVDFLNCKTIN